MGADLVWDQRDGERDVTDRHPGQRVDQVKALEDRDERHEDRDARQHVGDHHGGVRRASGGKPKPGNRVGPQGPEQRRDSRGCC